jgi:putative intracellular protease/amidase
MEPKIMAIRRGFVACLLSLTLASALPTPATILAATPAAVVASDSLPPYQDRFSRPRPVVAIVGENFFTEATDYVIPYGVIAQSGAAEVFALATKPGPIRLFSALQVQPQETVADFDTRFPQGADYVIVPAVHRDEDPTLLQWLREQAARGATIVGVCDGVRVVANAGLLEGRRATAHWHSFDSLERKFPNTHWLRDTRYVADGRVITTAGVTASIPVSLALVEAIAGHSRAVEVARRLGVPSWSAKHNSGQFSLGAGEILRAAWNYLAFWSHQDFYIPLSSSTDEISLALMADAYSSTFRSRVYTYAATAGAVTTSRGLRVIPDRVGLSLDADGPELPAVPPDAPASAVDIALKSIAASYGSGTARLVALKMEYPGDLGATSAQN